MNQSQRQQADSRIPTREASLLDDIQVADSGFVLDTGGKLLRWAEWRFKNNLAPPGYRSPADIVIAVEAGLRFGFDRNQSLSAFCVINGVAKLYGKDFLGVIWKSGLCEFLDCFLLTEATLADLTRQRAEAGWSDEQWVDALRLARTGVCDDTLVAVAVTKRKGQARMHEARFSAADAKRAGLWGRTSRDGKAMPWTSYQRDMLPWKGYHRVCLVYADVTAGIGLAEDLLADIEVADEPQVMRPRAKVRLPAEADKPAPAEARAAEPQPLAEPESAVERAISIAQAKRLHAIRRSSEAITEEEFRAALKARDLESTKEIPLRDHQEWENLVTYGSFEAPPDAT